MTTTVAKVLADTRNFIMGTRRDVYNTLGSDIDADDTTLSFGLDSSNLTDGSYLEIDVEVMLLVSASAGTVIRGFLGSTAATHTSGALIRVNSVYFDYWAMQELNGELLDLCSPSNGLFKVGTVDLTYNAANVGYDLTSTTTVEDILDVRYKTPDATKSWPRANFELARTMSTGDFASGNALMIKSGGFPGQTMRVFYKAPYTAVTATTDTLESNAGVHTEAVDLPAIGAAIRVATTREVQRNFFETQGDTKRPDEVPAGANTSALAGLRSLRQARISSEAARLQARWPGFGRRM